MPAKWRVCVCVAPEPEALYTLDGYTQDQRFFLAWARAWQTKRRDEALRQQISTDPHSPEDFRCNQVVRNVPAFYAAFDVQRTDAAWLDPSDRVKIW